MTWETIWKILVACATTGGACLTAASVFLVPMDDWLAWATHPDGRTALTDRALRSTCDEPELKRKITYLTQRVDNLVRQESEKKPALADALSACPIRINTIRSFQIGSNETQKFFGARGSPAVHIQTGTIGDV